MNRKRIILIPDASYLSNPIFIGIGRKSGPELLTIYLNPNFPFSRYEKDENYSDLEDKQIFDEYTNIDKKFFNSFKGTLFKRNIVQKLISFWTFIFLFSKYNRKFKDKLNSIKPDAIVMTSDVSVVNLIVNKWATGNNVPVIVVQSAFLEIVKPTFKQEVKRLFFHTFFNVILQLPFERKQFKYGHESDNCYLFLWGSFFAGDFEKLKANNRLRITGNPAFDLLFNESNIPDEDLLRLAKGKPIITIFTHKLEGVLSEIEIQEVENGYREIINNNKNWFFIVKIHPRESDSKYINLFHPIKSDNFIITKEITVKSILSVAKVHITVFSFSSFEAVLSGVPIILFMRDLVSHFDAFNNEIEFRSNSLSELKKHITEAISTEFRSEFTRKREMYIGSRLSSTDGKSSERVLQEIEKIVIQAN